MNCQWSSIYWAHPAYSAQWLSSVGDIGPIAGARPGPVSCGGNGLQC